LGATALVAIMEPVTENSSSGAPNSPWRVTPATKSE
jgi:hypothetical protein